MSFFESFFGFLPYVFSIVLGWGERVFSSVGVSFVGWAIFAVGSAAIVKIFAPVVGQAVGEAGVTHVSMVWGRHKERYKKMRDSRNEQKRLSK